MDLPADLLFKSLNWRRGSCAGNRIWSFNNQRGIFRYFGNRRRSYPSGSWLFRYGARSRCTPNPGSRCGLPVSPGISDQRTCDRADWSQNERSRSSASSALLSLCFERDKRPCDYRRNKQFLHGGFLEYAPRHRTSRLRQHKGDPPESPARIKHVPGVLSGCHRVGNILTWPWPAQHGRRADGFRRDGPPARALRRAPRQSNGPLRYCSTRQIGASSLARGYMRRRWLASSAEGRFCSHKALVLV